MIAADCVDCAPDSPNGSGEFFMATGGMLNITAISQTTIRGTLSNVTFTHVTIANTGPSPTFVSTPVGDDCDTRIGAASFASSVTTP